MRATLNRPLGLPSKLQEYYLLAHECPVAVVSIGDAVVVVAVGVVSDAVVVVIVSVVAVIDVPLLLA